MKRQLKNIIVGIAALFAVVLFVQCDSTTAEEYKAQAIEYAESGEHEKAAEAYLKAAEKGDAEAQFIVGLLFMDGKSVKDNPIDQDIDKSLYWLKKSAEQDNGDAYFILAQLYDHGQLVPRDLNKAIHYYELSVKRNVGLACYVLACHYLEGDYGFAKDQDKALALLKQAYEAGVLSAGSALAAIFMTDERYEDSFVQTLEFWNKVNKKEYELVGLDYDKLDEKTKISVAAQVEAAIVQYDYAQYFGKYKI